VFVRVRTTTNQLGIGKLAAYDAGTGSVQIEYFNSPTDQPTILTANANTVQRIELAPQTRAYWQDSISGTWRVGRVIDGEGELISVRFPNGAERLLPTKDVFVRWNRPIADPTSYLAKKVNETPAFADGRSGFVESLIAQRGVCQGLSAVLSSVIELETHQLEVVRRVLQDPQQRYLLADEVGLGKTIEAGILIRQYVLDDPEGHKITIVVPSSLRSQWRDELNRRFLLQAEIDKTIKIVAMDDVADVASNLTGLGMLVVDEAHHLSQISSLYQTIQHAAAGIPRLLLLSATPVLHNEQSFLEMLHLLDPDAFPLDEAEMFRRKIEGRQMLAETVGGLLPENVLQLDGFLDRLSGFFEDDCLLKSHIANLRSVLATLPEETNPDFLVALSSLKAHLTETYRLDRRILRNRRRSVEGLTPERIGVAFQGYRCSATRRLLDAIEVWRGFTAARLYGREDTSEAEQLSAWFADVLNAVLSEDDCAGPMIHKRLEEFERDSETEEIKLLEEILRAINEDRREERLRALASSITPSTASQKFVVFCTGSHSAERVTDFLRMQLPSSVERVRGADTAAVQKFIEDSTQRVLVCDSRYEEGLNLQGGSKVVVHYDIPIAPNRIEQRLGRVDRYGSGDGIKSLVLRCIDNSFELAWADCLDKGWNVFHRSIASLQYLVDGKVGELRRRLLTDGTEAIDALTEELTGPNGEVARELSRIDQQDALDSLSTPVSDATEQLFEVDGEWRSFQERVEKWLVTTLQMSKVRGPDVGAVPPGDCVSRFGLVRYGQRQTLIPLPDACCFSRRRRKCQHALPR
jgi:ATP-dependent helicase HepA